MFSRTITAENADKVLLDLVWECDSLELERIIPALDTALRFARNRSLRGTICDQRMHEASKDENYCLPPSAFADMTDD